MWINAIGARLVNNLLTNWYTCDDGIVETVDEDIAVFPTLRKHVSGCVGPGNAI